MPHERKLALLEVPRPGAGDSAIDGPDTPIKRAGRVAVLQHVEAIFDPLPYDQGAARLYGQICAAIRAAGREPCRRASDLIITATAASNQLPLYGQPGRLQGR